MIKKNLILASQSPRRKQLLELAELQFDVVNSDVEEIIPADKPKELVPEYLAIQKAEAVFELHEKSIVIAADTIVLLQNEILGKPEHKADAMAMLKKLSGKKHTVITGVCIKSAKKQITFSVSTEVFFRILSTEQIEHYVAQYKPYDKASAYAIQEWIGVVGIEKIIGDYYNVMGLPIGEVLIELEAF